MLFKGTNRKNWGFWVEKKGREKTEIVKVPKSCHQVTWAQMIQQQREKDSKLLILMSLNVNS